MMITLLTSVYAQTKVNILPGGQFGNLGNITITNIIVALITIMLVITALVFFFLLIWGGIEYITSGGDKMKTEAARGRITAALIGITIVFGVWGILTLVNAFFGVNILKLNIPSAQGCITFGQSCPGPAGTQDGCCAGLTCVPSGIALTCQ